MLIINALLPHTSTPTDIEVDKGIITRTGSAIPKGSHEIIDAGNKLIAPPFVDPHVHLDAVLMSTYIRPNKSGTLLEGIEIWGECRKKADKETYLTHARTILQWYLDQGTQYIRSHVDTTAPGQINVDALLQLRDEYKGKIDIQLTAFPQDGIYTYPEGEHDMRRAMDKGCDAVGGIPHNELTREDGVRDVEFAFALADEYPKGGGPAFVDLHCDETGDPQSRFVEVMVKEAMNRGTGEYAAASHVTAMHNYDNDYAFKLIGLIARSKISIITNPFDNIYLQNRNDGYPRRRGHTRVDELHSRGVNVGIGNDSIMDPWYPLGEASMLQAAHMLLHTAHMTSAEQTAALFDMITIHNAQILGISDSYGIEAEKPANLNIFPVSTVFEALRLRPKPEISMRNGVICS